MDWHATPIEYRSNFQPPFCPWRDCDEHLRRTPGYGFLRHGSFSTSRRRRIPRFRCRTCKRTFSRQTFSVSYYRKRPELLGGVAAGLVAGSALRQIARSLDCAPGTAAGDSAHLGRHAMLLQARTLAHLRGRLAEPVVFDHFESFEFTQDYSFGVGTAVGAGSWFVYGLDPAPHGRGGPRSTAQQHRLRCRPERPMYGRYLGSTRRMLDLLFELRRPDRDLRLRSDAHPDYRIAARGHPLCRLLHLRSYANPSRGPRGTPPDLTAIARDRAMFPVDLLHKIFRHSLAHHRRETIAFPRRINAAMERLFLAAAWRNFIKKRSERTRSSPTPAMLLGLTDRRWNWRTLLSHRLFFDRIPLPRAWDRLYRRGWVTPLLHSNAKHDLTRAF